MLYVFVDGLSTLMAAHLKQAQWVSLRIIRQLRLSLKQSKMLASEGKFRRAARLPTFVHERGTFTQFCQPGPHCLKVFVNAPFFILLARPILFHNLAQA